MSELTLLDPTKTGRQAEDLNNKLRHVIVGQEEAIHQSRCGTVSGRPADCKSLVPGAYWLGKNTHRGGHRVSAQGLSIGNQDRLRGVSA